MLKKATQENIVVEVSNLYDTFFVQLGESRVLPSAVRLPYFDGDYWPGAMEDELAKIEEDMQAEEGKGGKLGAGKKGKKTKPTSKRGSGFKGMD